MTKSLISAVALLTLAGAASANHTFLTAYGNTLYVTSGNLSTTTTFSLSDDLTSLAFNPVSGRVYGTSRSDDNGDGFYELYEIKNPTTAPTLSLVGDFLANNTASIVFAGSNMYGFQQSPGVDGPSDVVSIDYTGAPSQTYLGTMTNARVAGSGYDPANDVVWGLERRGPVYSIAGPFSGADTLTGSTGSASNNIGGEFWNGTMYAAIETNGAGPGDFDLRLGSVNVGGDGSFTALLDLSLDNADANTVGLAVIPTPGAAVLAGVAGLAALRRRRA